MDPPAPSSWSWSSFGLGFLIGAIFFFVLIIILANTLKVPNKESSSPP